MTPDDVGRLSIPHIIALIDAFGEANKDSDSQGDSKNSLHDSDAFKYLMDNPM